MRESLVRDVVATLKPHPLHGLLPPLFRVPTVLLLVVLALVEPVKSRLQPPSPANAER